MESESLKTREEFAKLFELANSAPKLYGSSGLARQEDHDFEDTSSTTPKQSASSPSSTTSTSTPNAVPSTTTMKPDEEAAKIGFDVEALKKLGEEIGKRLDQFGKEAKKNLGDLIEGVKLVFREPNKRLPKKPHNSTQIQIRAPNPDQIA